MNVDNNYDYWSLLGALIISTVSGTISIAQRIVLGQRATLIWTISEFLAAILCGYLVFDAYPAIQEDLPKWATMPVLVALAAHVGGRSFQMMERALYRKYKFMPKRNPPLDELE
jgi:hypothetical protein